MPKFTVKIERTVVTTRRFEVEASSPEEAEELASELAEEQKELAGDEAKWDLDEEFDSVAEVEEE